MEAHSKYTPKADNRPVRERTGVLPHVHDCYQLDSQGEIITTDDDSGYRFICIGVE